MTAATTPTKAELTGDFGRRLQELDAEFQTFRAVAGHRIGELERTVGNQVQAIAGLLQQNVAREERLKVLEKHSDHPAAISARDQRLKTLEKGTDRVWQLLPVAVSAVALLVAAYVAFVKKWPAGVVWLLVMSARVLAELIDAHSAALAVYARQWCGSPDDAVQEAFCKLAAASPWPDDPAAWLFTVAKHAAMDIGKAERRRKRREGAVAKPERWFHEPAADGLDAETAVDALGSCPVNCGRRSSSGCGRT